MRRPHVLVLFLGMLLTSMSGACVKRDTAVETRPLADTFAAYWTCAVVFASDGRGDDANESFTFVPWFESRVRDEGVFEPLARREAKEAEVTLRLDATSSTADRVLLRLLLIDTKSRSELGEISSEVDVEEAVKEAVKKAPESETSDARRLVALRAAADRILAHLRERRRLASSKKAAPAPAPELPSEPVGGSAVCSTQCVVPAATSSSHEEQYRVAAGVDPMMRALRECLDRVGGQLVVPAVLLRFGPDGRLRHVRVDVGGYEELECIQEVRMRPVRASTTRASILRCEHKCTTS